VISNEARDVMPYRFYRLYRAVLRPVGGGLALAAVTYVATQALPDAHRLPVHAVLLSAIGAVYVGFAIADGRRRMLVLESTGALAFVGLATAGLVYGTAVLAAGYALHAVWDVLHHDSHVPNRHAPWYIPLCVVYDVAVALYLVLG